MPARLDVAAARNVPWNPTLILYYFGDPLPLTGATIAMQVRLYPGAPGAALIDLATVTYADAAAATDTQPTRRSLSLFPNVPELTLAGMPTGLNEPEAGEADKFSHDIVITYADAVQERLAYGDFLLENGVTK